MYCMKMVFAMLFENPPGPPAYTESQIYKTTFLATKSDWQQQKGSHFLSSTKHSYCHRSIDVPAFLFHCGAEMHEKAQIQAAHAALQFTALPANDSISSVYENKNGLLPTMIFGNSKTHPKLTR